MALRTRSRLLQPPRSMSSIFDTTNRSGARFFSDHISITFVTAEGEEVLVSEPLHDSMYCAWTKLAKAAHDTYFRVDRSQAWRKFNGTWTGICAYWEGRDVYQSNIMQAKKNQLCHMCAIFDARTWILKLRAMELVLAQLAIVYSSRYTI